MPFNLKHVLYEGVNYVASAKRIDAKDAAPVQAKRVYVANDQSGITDIIVSTSNALPKVKEMPNIFWTSFEIDKAQLHSFCLRGDVSFLFPISHPDTAD